MSADTDIPALSRPVRPSMSSMCWFPLRS